MVIEFMKRKSIYSDCINDVALEISISKIWRNRIFELKKDEILHISFLDEKYIPEYIKDVIVKNKLTFCVQVVDDCEVKFDDELIVFKFWSEEYPEITEYSGNNPLVR